MRTKADADGRYPLSSREYVALCCLMGTLHALTQNKEELKDRLHLFNGGWRDIQLAASALDRTFNRLLETIPLKKLLSIRREMRYMVCETKLNPAAKNPAGDEIFITNDVLRGLVNRAIAMDCTFCEKSASECRRCELFKDVEACYPYELTKPGSALCPLAGATKL